MDLGLGLGVRLIPTSGSGVPDFTASISGLTDYSDFGLSAATGVELTAVAAGFTGAPPGSVSYQWMTAESGVIAGATGARYTPDASVRDGETLRCSISAPGYPTRATPGFVIRHLPPSAGGAIADLDLAIGQNATVTGIASDFAGQDLSFALAAASDPLPVSLSLNADGSLSGAPGALVSGLTIVVEASNSGGNVQSGFSLSTFDRPDAFAASDWAAAPGGTPGTLAVTIAALPAENNAPITGVAYRLDGGAWTDAGGTGDFTLSGLQGGQTYEIELRALNAAGASDASDTKSATPDSSGTGTGTGDVVAPVVQIATYDDQAREVTLNITEATGSSTVFWALVTNPSTPSAAQIEAGAGGGVIEAGSFQSTSGGDVDMIDVTDEQGNEIHLFARDASGNDSGITVITGIVVDNTPPAFQSALPAAGATGVDPNTDLVLSFSENLAAPATVGTFRIFAQGSLVETFDTVSGAGDQGGALDISGADVTLTPGAPLASGADVSVQWSAGAVTDHYGNPVAANASDTLYAFSVVNAVTASITKLGIQNSGSAFGSIKTYDFSLQAGRTQYIAISGRFDSTSIASVELLGSGAATVRQPLVKTGNYGAAIYEVTAATSGQQTVQVTLSGGRNHIKCGVVETEGYAFSRPMTATQQGGNNAGAGGGQLVENDTDTSLGEGVIAVVTCSDGSQAGFSALNGYDGAAVAEQTNTADAIMSASSVAGGAPETFNLTYGVAFKACVLCGVVLS